ncbi:MAG: methyltransferase domain-containing protein [Actinomycetota bacterium]|nr:methyltransferase domain-containing protein [Actinomycetota bacterium]
MSDSEYLFENEAPEAGDRFDALGALFDPVSLRHLDDLGVTSGWHCLDVGAGGGSVAIWLAARVGSSGRVLATDLDVRWLEHRLRAHHIEVRQHDIVHDDLPERSFDLVHERLVLIHVRERIAALEHMVAALRPGGWLLAEDFDSAFGTDLYVDQPSEDEALGNRIMTSVRSLLAQRGADTALGHRLPQLLREAGLEEVSAEGYQSIIGGNAARRLQRANIVQVADQLVEQGLVARDELDRYLTALGEGTVSPRSALLVSARGRRAQT